MIALSPIIELDTGHRRAERNEVLEALLRQRRADIHHARAIRPAIERLVPGLDETIEL